MMIKLKHRVIKIVLIVLAMAFVGILIFVMHSTIAVNKKIALYQKSDDSLIGERIVIQREGQNSIHGNVYIPENQNEKMPLIINIHGGAFISGDADSLDTQSKRISNDNNAVVFTIDYTLVEPYRMILFPQSRINYEINEVIDSVKYFRKNAAEYNIDPDRVVIMGYSAGGHLALAATNKLAEQGEPIWTQIIGYGYLKDGIELYNKVPCEYRKLSNTLIIFTTESDFISESMREYYDILQENSVSVAKLEYPDANHGFLEENNPEYENLEESVGRSEEQKRYMMDAESKIRDWLAGLSY